MPLSKELGIVGEGLSAVGPSGRLGCPARQCQPKRGAVYHATHHVVPACYFSTRTNLFDVRMFSVPDAFRFAIFFSMRSRQRRRASQLELRAMTSQADRVSLAVVNKHRMWARRHPELLLVVPSGSFQAAVA